MRRVLRPSVTFGSLRIKKVLLIAGLSALVIFVPYAILFSGARVARVDQAVAPTQWFISALMMAGLAALAPLVYLALVRRLEDRVLRDQRRYHHTLITASSGMTRIKEINRLCRLIVYVVNRTVGLTHTGIFLYEPKSQRYALRAVRHRQMMPAQLFVDQHDPLIEIIQEARDLVILDELQGEMGASQSDEETRKRAWSYSWMRKLEGKLIVPSFSNDRLLAFLVLGVKRNGSRYTTDDIAIFSGLANQAALAIENAMVFEELQMNEAYMIQSEKLASLGQLASGMAHEIHNPLTIISGEAQLFLERFKGQHEQADEVLASIIEECQRAADITRRILRFAKPAPSDMVPVDMSAILDETLTLAGYQVRMDRVERTVTIQPDLPKVRGNQNQLQEVLLNLVLNACQAMGEAGGSLKLWAGANGAQVHICVEDSGPGMAHEQLLRIFDPFFTTKQTGTGLGLFVCQRIVQAHGGIIEVESESGKGTRFTVKLPVLRQPAAEPAGAARGRA